MTRTELIRSIGHVKVAFIGRSNSGKSTLVNGLCNKYIVPECSHTSTMMTTYLGRIPKAVKESAVMDSRGKLKDYSLAEFRDSFSYSDKYYDNLKSRYVDKYAFVNVKHQFSNSGIVLIDTIGIGVNEYDTRRTAAVTRGADIIVYLYDALDCANLRMTDMEFLTSIVFPKGRKPLLPCDRIFFVPNKIDKVSSVTELCRDLKCCFHNFVSPLSNDYEQLCNNIIPISSLYYRLATTGPQELPVRSHFQDTESFEIAHDIAVNENDIYERLNDSLIVMSNVKKLINAISQISKSIS